MSEVSCRNQHFESLKNHGQTALAGQVCTTTISFFSGTGGDTITKQVALIPVCFGKTPGIIRAAVLEDTAEAPLLLSLPILQALKECPSILAVNPWILKPSKK